jgi:hypothetical protein
VRLRASSPLQGQQGKYTVLRSPIRHSTHIC